MAQDRQKTFCFSCGRVLNEEGSWIIDGHDPVRDNCGICDECESAMRNFIEVRNLKYELETELESEGRK